MPYRRLPNTDQARLRAIQTAVNRALEADFKEQVIHYQTLTEARNLLMRFHNQVSQYQDNFNTRVSANKQYRRYVQNVRMYISHFIQVLNMSVIRGEIKKDQKKLYHLDPNRHNLPDLSTDEALLEWGKNIIEGEQERVRNGGFPIYNPTINKVMVHYDIFKENQMNQHIHKKTETRVYEDLETLRAEADRVILDIWNQVDEYYKDLLPYARMKASKTYGIIHYYRKGERRLSEDTDKQLRDRSSKETTLQLSY